MSDHGSLPTDVARLIDACCVEFEQAWRSDAQPRLEDFLERFDESFSHRERLFEELLRVEWEFLFPSGVRPLAAAYHDRFPSYRQIIDRLLERYPQETGKTQLTQTVTYGRVDQNDQTPETIGRYQIQRAIGRGGFGVVYLARDPQMDCLVAIKRLRIGDVESVLGDDRSDAADLMGSLLREARLAAKLRKHPAIVSILDVLTIPTKEGFGPEVCLVQEYIEGGDLRARIRQGRIPPAETVRILRQVARAMAHAHKYGIYHRDLKPGNILLDAQGNPFVTDFGLAVDEQLQRRRKGEVAGTIPYMAPEQTRGEAHLLDGRADIWALGIIMYEMLTQSRPFRGDSTADVFDEICRREPRPPRMLNPQIPNELERICLRCLAKRMTDRYSTASDLAAELDDWESGPGPAKSVNDPSQSGVMVVPKGLRSFDADDADFFLDLLPGPRDRHGIPESVRFWKQRIETDDEDRAFRVGLLYGPSGSGKSSLVKAGLLPKLSRVQPVYVEATAIDTEARILVQLRKVAPSLSRDLSLPEAIARLREDPQRSGSAKTLLVLDQFEQWLQARRSFGGEQLIEALRQCDGTNVQVLILIRDDFWMAITRFLHELEVELVQGENVAAVDLFGLEHSESVLTRFGQAYGTLQPDSEPTAEQQQFIGEVVDRVAQDGKVVCIRLAVFAEMIKDKRWIPETIAKLGGATGIGETFLEDAFCGPSASPQHRAIEQPARAVLRTLLPDKGSDIKGHMITREELHRRSGCGDDRGTFDQVIRVLDSELRLITPTDPDSLRSAEDRSANRDQSSHYQLTHDYLIPSLRNWLNRKQRSTAKGRAELLLEERADEWAVQPENRNLPTLTELLSIVTRTSSHSWSDPQRALMRQARRFYGVRSAIAASLIGLLVVLGIVAAAAIGRHNNQVRGEEIVRSVLASSLSELPEQVGNLQPYRQWSDPMLQAAFEDHADASPQKLRAALAMADRDDSKWPYLFERLLSCEAEELQTILTFLRPARDWVTDRAWQMVEAKQGDGVISGQSELRLAATLAAFDPEDDRWRTLGQPIASGMLRVPLDELGTWKSSFLPAKRWLSDDLNREFNQREPGDPLRSVAANLLADYVAEDPQQLVALISSVEPSELPQFIPAIKRHGEPGTEALRDAFDQVKRFQREPANDPQLSDEIRQLIDRSDGCIGAAAALVQRAQPSDFDRLNQTLQATGYHPVSLRPYVERGQKRFAACWHRGKRDSEVATDLSPPELANRNQTAGNRGFRICDIAYHDHKVDDVAAPRLAAVWVKSNTGNLETMLHVDLSATAHEQTTEQMLDQGFTLYRLATTVDAHGMPRFTSIWRANADPREESAGRNRIRYAPRFGDVYPGFLQTDLRLDAVDLAKPDLFDQVVNSQFLSYQADRLEDPSSQSLSDRLILARYHLLFRQFDQSAEQFESLLTEQELSRSQRASVHENLAKIHFYRADLEKLKQSLAGFSEQSSDETKTLTLQLRIDVLSEDLPAVAATLEKLDSVCNRYDNRIAHLIAFRGHAIAASLAGDPGKDYLDSARAWFERLSRSARASDFEKTLADIDFDTFRGEPSFQKRMKEEGFAKRVTGVWGDDDRHGSRMITMSGSDQHRRRCEQSMASGLRPILVDAMAAADQGESHYGSLWHFETETQADRERREIAIANLVIALAQCGQDEHARAVLADQYGHSPRWQFLDRLAESEMPAESVAQWFDARDKEATRRNMLLALAQYPASSFDRIDRLRESVQQLARTADDTGTRSAAQWCLRRWGETSAPEGFDKVPGNIQTETPAPPALVRIEPARFLMGSPTWDPNGNEEETQHWQEIGRKYAIAIHETTVAQFQRFLDDEKVKAYYEERSDFSFTRKYAPRPDCPQTSVRWFDAALYCQWLSEREGVAEDQWCFPGIWSTEQSEFKLPDDYLKRTGYRLPTEAEWEYACRGGTQSDYPHGFSPQLLPHHAWYLLNSLPPNYFTRPVGMTPPNDLGLFDMIGNVNEWCMDAKQFYAAPFDGYLRRDTAEDDDLTPWSVDRVVRGGSFDSVPNELRCADRKQAAAGYKRFSLGFRIARTVKE